MNAEIQKKYDQRLKDYIETLNVREPDHILVQAGMLTAQMGLYGLTIQDCLDDPRKYVQQCTNMYRDFAIDIMYPGMINPLDMVWGLDRNTYFVSEDGVTVQHQEAACMEADEYLQLIADPMEFMLNTLCARKFPLLTQEYPQSYEVLLKAAKNLQKHNKMNREYVDFAKERYGVLSIGGVKSYPPFDVIFDRLRGFAGTMKDIRRYADRIGQACEAMLPIYMKPLEALNDQLPKHAKTTIHAPTFMRPADFEKYFWPTYKKMLMYAYEKGSKTYITCEGKMEQLYDLFMDLPKASVILNLEGDDMFKIKKKCGHYFAIEGNYPVGMMKYKTKQECLDFAKKVCDECGAGGGFIFGVDLNALSTSDVNVENTQAVYQFVHDYK